MQELLAFLLDRIRRGGQMTLDYRLPLRELKFESKATPRDIVTEADSAVERYLISEIRAVYPDHAIWGEETGRSGDPNADYRWVIDPIDGTNSFLYGQPSYATSIAIERGGEVVLGAVYAPVLDELYHAVRGGGAFCNGEPIHASSCAVLAESMLATGLACLRAEAEYHVLPFFNDFAVRCRDLRRMGSAAVDLCFVAAGRFDGYFELSLNHYDIAAGILIVTEAGGTVTDFRNQQDGLPGEVLATNGPLHPAMLDRLQTIGRDAYPAQFA